MSDTMSIMNRVASILGGGKSLCIEPQRPLDWVYMVRKGFPSAALISFGVSINAANTEVARMLGMSVRTMAVRMQKGVLTPYESERLFHFARVIARTEEVFEDLDNGLAWLNSPNSSLGGITPISLLDTYIGADWVMDTLGRIEHGVFS